MISMECSNNYICYIPLFNICLFIYGHPYLVVSYTILYSFQSVFVTSRQIVLLVNVSIEFLQSGFSTLLNRMLALIIISHNSFENSAVLCMDGDAEALLKIICCLSSLIFWRLALLVCFTVLIWCCVLKQFSAVTSTKTEHYQQYRNLLHLTKLCSFALKDVFSFGMFEPYWQVIC